jgi:hypothetical protein
MLEKKLVLQFLLLRGQKISNCCCYSCCCCNAREAAGAANPGATVTLANQLVLLFLLLL